MTVKQVLTLGSGMVAALVALVVAAVVIFGDSSGNLMFQGAVMEKAPVKARAVPAAGTNLRTYSFEDAHGRFCTGVYSEKGGSWGDCDFPPGWEPSDGFLGQ